MTPHLRHLVLSAGCWLGLALAAPAAAQETLWTPEDAEALQGAQTALTAGNARGALTTLDGLAARYPGSVDVARLRGLALLALERRSEARAVLATALSRGAFSPDVLGALLEIDYAAKRTPAVLASAGLMLLLDPDNPEWSLLYGDLLLESGRAAAAEVVYTALLDADAVTPALYERLARTAYGGGRVEEAASLFETAWYLGDERPSTPETLARLWLELGDLERAERWRRVSQQEDAADDGLLEARRAWAAGDLARAEALAAAVEESGPEQERAAAAALRGRVADQRGEDDVALEHFRRAVDGGLDAPDVLVLLGSRAYNDGAFSEALKVLGRAWDGGRRDASLLPFLVQSALSVERPAAADRFLVEYLELHGLDETARRMIARRAAAD